MVSHAMMVGVKMLCLMLFDIEDGLVKAFDSIGGGYDLLFPAEV